jgi:hypothetical protein
MDAGGEITPQDPPWAVHESILPLDSGNTWHYSYTEYDTTGNPDPRLSRLPLRWSITGSFGSIGDTSLVAVTRRDSSPQYDSYVFALQWSGASHAFLISYYDTPGIISGIYIVGEQNKGKNRLYNEKKLWLAYPADSGTQWELTLPGDSDSGQSVTMELCATDAPFYFPDSVDVPLGGVRFYECYLYKQTDGATETYYYYTEKTGALGYVQYHNGYRTRSYILRDYSLAKYEYRNW